MHKQQNRAGAVPPAESEENIMEWLSDKEKRILLSALTREKEVCTQVDKQREPIAPYEQSLKSICESLEHKFYYDRLFKQMEKQIRTEAIDDFVNRVLKEGIIGLVQYAKIKEIAEQLKESV